MTIQEDPTSVITDLYTMHHWAYWYEAGPTILDNNLIKYDLPLGLGHNDAVLDYDNNVFDMEHLQHDPLDNYYYDERDGNFDALHDTMHCINNAKQYHFETLHEEIKKINVTCGQLQLQSDMGANINITTNKQILRNLQQIALFPIDHASKITPMMVYDNGDI